MGDSTAEGQLCLAGDLHSTEGRFKREKVKENVGIKINQRGSVRPEEREVGRMSAYGWLNVNTCSAKVTDAPGWWRHVNVCGES